MTWLWSGCASETESVSSFHRSRATNPPASAEQRGHDPHDGPRADTLPSHDRQRDEADPNQGRQHLYGGDDLGSIPDQERARRERLGPAKRRILFHVILDQLAERGGGRRVQNVFTLPVEELFDQLAEGVLLQDPVDREAPPSNVVAIVTDIAFEQVRDDLPGAVDPLAGYPGQ